ncbi:hypothetical protein [Velocimicrobium porci]|uniref:Uncharacterized protein n=1 Tax=Velocimicrobium porci TaxID=2606634 RepID=A0A6L5XX86_9FIRM|nr:hypothetical protein [Velocimicrobium porci]MSS63157.1 hypothetical protein [Velocimicrobium porci]
MKLNQLLKENDVKVYGFQAFKDLEKHCSVQGDTIILATDSPSLMIERGYEEYYAPVIPFGSRFNKAQEILDADLEVNKVTVHIEEDITREDEVVIVSTHTGTRELLEHMFANSTPYEKVNKSDVEGRLVVGTLPAHLIQYAQKYKSVIVKNFDWSKDQSLSGKELEERLMIGKTISVEIEE